MGYLRAVAARDRVSTQAVEGQRATISRDAAEGRITLFILMSVDGEGTALPRWLAGLRAAVYGEGGGMHGALEGSQWKEGLAWCCACRGASNVGMPCPPLSLESFRSRIVLG